MRIQSKLKPGGSSGCAVCGLTAAYQFNEIGKTGECKYCRGFERRSFKGGEKLLEDLALQPGEKIGVTVSGGKDSIYMLGVLQELLGADLILALSFYRPGLTSETAMDNIRKTAGILGTELLTVTDREAYARFRRNFEILLENPNAAAVRVLLCAGCRYGVTARLYAEGQKRNIRKYFSAASYLELAPFKEELLEALSPRGDSADGLERLIAEYPALNYDDNLAIIRRDHHYKYKNNQTMRGQLHVGPDIQLFDFDDYFENNPEQIEKTVIQKYGWQKTNRSWHFDCIIEDIKDVFYYGLLGYTEMDFKTAAMVRYGLLTAERAHEIIAAFDRKIANSYGQMAEFLKQHQLTHRMPQLDMLYKNSPYLVFPADSAAARQQ